MITRMTSRSVLVLPAIITFYFGRIVVSSFSFTFLITTTKVSRLSPFAYFDLNNYGDGNLYHWQQKHNFFSPWSSIATPDFKSGLKSTSSSSSDDGSKFNDNDRNAMDAYPLHSRNEQVKNKIIDAVIIKKPYPAGASKQMDILTGIKRK